ncbi:MAG: hypothetical protein MZU97_20205 [Bacillus subtilis]|nr:hypothetical protein [Bacillus subtilis]
METMQVDLNRDNVPTTEQKDPNEVFQDLYRANRELLFKKRKPNPILTWGLRIIYLNIGFWIPLLGFCLWAVFRVDRRKDAIYPGIAALVSALITLVMRFLPIVIRLIEEVRNYPQ